jgi:hypothetical protein
MNYPGASSGEFSSIKQNAKKVSLIRNIMIILRTIHTEVAEKQITSAGGVTDVSPLLT